MGFIARYFNKNPVAVAHCGIPTQPSTVRPTKRSWFTKAVGAISTHLSPTVTATPVRPASAVAKGARHVSRAWAHGPSIASPVSQPAQGSTSNIKNIVLPADPARPDCFEFPHCVQYSIGDAPVSPMNDFGRPLGEPAVTSQLVSCIKSRQGFIEWNRDLNSSLMGQIMDRLVSGEPIDLHGARIHGADLVRQGSDLAEWTLEVSAPCEDRPGKVEVFYIPVTQCVAPASKVSLLTAPRFLATANIALCEHLKRVEWGYGDSVHMPLLLNSGVTNNAEWMGLNAELRSLKSSGGIQSDHELTQTFHALAEQFGVQNSSGVNPKDIVGGGLGKTQQPSVSQSTLSDLDRILLSRRHQPHPREEPQPSLAGLRPAVAMPSTLAAYRQPQSDNHCALAAINAFFQADVVNSAQVANQIVRHWEEVFTEPGQSLADLSLPGLYIPEVLEALRAGESVRISRAQFCGPSPHQIPAEYEAMYMDSPAGQWDALCNFALGPTASRPNEILITPELWLSASTGLHIDQLETLINSLLASRNLNDAWANWPGRVERIGLQTPARLANLEEDILHAVAQNKMQGGSEAFQMVCMVPGHFFAIGRTAEGDWVKLGSDGTRDWGVQPSPLFAEQGQLGMALKNVKAIHLLCQPLAPHD